MNQPAALAVTVIHKITIECSCAKAFDFLTDGQQWLPWAFPCLDAVQPLPFGQWLLKTPRTLTKLRPFTGLTQGELNFELTTPRAGKWLVPLRLTPTPLGCQLAITLTKPELLPLTAFEKGVHYLAEGLNTLKLVLEQD